MTERTAGEGAARDVDVAGKCAQGRRGDQAGIAAWLDAPGLVPRPWAPALP